MAALSALILSRRARVRVGRVRALADRAVTVYAINLDGVAHFAVELAVAVVVLPEVTIHAMHAFLDVYVFQVDGQAFFGRPFDGFFELGGVHVADDVAVGVEEIALAVGLEDVAEYPAVAVEVGKLRA